MSAKLIREIVKDEITRFVSESLQEHVDRAVQKALAEQGGQVAQVAQEPPKKVAPRVRSTPMTPSIGKAKQAEVEYSAQEEAPAEEEMAGEDGGEAEAEPWGADNAQPGKKRGREESGDVSFEDDPEMAAIFAELYGEPQDAGPPSKKQKGGKGWKDGKGGKDGKAGKGEKADIGRSMDMNVGSTDEVDGIQDGLLPIRQREAEVLEALFGDKQVTCIGGDTGSGKSTQVPQMIYNESVKRGEQVCIAVIQPRRVACLSLAWRVAEELGESGIGGTVGFRIGGESRRGNNIDFCSTGYFLQLLINSPQSLSSYTHVILDEVHERTAESDLLCFVTRRLLSGQNKGVRLVIMSATVNMQLFTKYFSRLVDTGSSPAVVNVGKKCFPVTEYWLEEISGAFPKFREIDKVAKVMKDGFPSHAPNKGKGKWGQQQQKQQWRIDTRHVEKFNQVLIDLLWCLAQGGSTIIIFLPGIAEITALWQETRTLMDGGHFQVLPLHSMIPREEQEAVFTENNPKVTRVILATDIAESSLTLPNISTVIDFGLHRRMDHGDRRSLACLSTKWISKAAAKQRSGRAGRTQPGVCVRMYPKNFYENWMDTHEPPETQSMPLDRLYLQAKQLCEKLGQTQKATRSPKAALMELVESPNVMMIDAARTELADLGAIAAPAEDAKITRFGQLCVQLPLDLRLARCVWLGVLFGCAADGIILAAGLSINDPFSNATAHFARSEEDFTQWLRESTQSRFNFDQGMQSEPLMLRQLFLEWLVTLHEKEKLWGPKDRVAQARRRHTDQFSRSHQLVKGRMDYFISQVLDLSLRTFHACRAGSQASHQLRMLIRTLGFSINQRGDLGPLMANEKVTIKAMLNGSEAIFEENLSILRALLASTFSDFFLVGTYFGNEPSKKGKGKGGNDEKEKHLALLRALADKEVPGNQAVFFNTQKDHPIEGIEKYVDHVCGRNLASPQEVLEGQSVIMVKVAENENPYPQLRSRPAGSKGSGSTSFELAILNNYANCMQEVQRFNKSGVEWTYGVYNMQHPHTIHWEFMQPTVGWNGKPVRCSAVCERRNPLGIVTRAPFTDQTFGNMRRIAVFGVASQVQGAQNPTMVYPVATSTLPSTHIAFILATAKYSNIAGGSRFGFTASGSITCLSQSIDLPEGVLNEGWWDRIQQLRGAIRRELMAPLPEHEDKVEIERAEGGVAPLVLTDAEDVLQCMCALLTEAVDYDGQEALESLEPANSATDLLQYDSRDLPVAFQPLTDWEDLENARTGKRAGYRREKWQAPQKAIKAIGDGTMDGQLALSDGAAEEWTGDQEMGAEAGEAAAEEGGAEEGGAEEAMEGW
mmetsp:Transcript_83178/g.144545  ORF Transcript_83178/g.144545 Transcript_83178/m.144545 type:complete len:1333 (-) Transcript_83178:254-4252(-)